MFISQTSEKDLREDVLNSYILINVEYFFDYLKQNHSLNIIGDSIIVCDDQFSPTHIGVLNSIIQLPGEPGQFLNGTFIIASNGNIKNVEIDSSKKYSDREIKKIIKDIYSSSGTWVLPPTPVQLQFKIRFRYEAVSVSRFLGTNLRLYPRDSRGILSAQQKAERDRHYNKGTISFKKQKFEDAVAEYKQCIAIDPIDIDVYYDLVSCYEQMGNRPAACEVLNKLKEMDQKKAEALSDQFCK